MADIKTSSFSCSVISLPKAARIILFLSCLGMFIVTFILFSIRDNKQQYMGQALALATFAFGMFSSIKNDPKHLKMFAYAIIGLALFGCLCNYGDYLDRNRKYKVYFSTFEGNKTNYDWYKNDTSVTKDWNNFQEKYKCCGLEGRADWLNLKPKNLTENKLPSSCCPIGSRNSTDGLCHFEKAFESGCKSEYASIENPFSAAFFGTLLKLFEFSLAGLAFYLAQPRFSSRFSPEAMSQP